MLTLTFQAPAVPPSASAYVRGLSPFSRRRTFRETGSLARFREFIELSPAGVSGCVANFSIAFPSRG